MEPLEEGRQFDGQADRKSRRSTGLRTVRQRYPGNPVFHRLQSSVQSIFIVPRGQLGRVNMETHEQRDRQSTSG